MCKTIASGKLLYNKELSSVPWDDLDGLAGETEERAPRGRGYMYPYG